MSYVRLLFLFSEGCELGWLCASSAPRFLFADTWDCSDLPPVCMVIACTFFFFILNGFGPFGPFLFLRIIS